MKDEKEGEGAGVDIRKSCNNKMKTYKDPNSTSVIDGMDITDSKCIVKGKSPWK